MELEGPTNKDGIAGVLSGSLITVVACALLVRAEADPDRKNVHFYKTLASTGFVTTAISSFWASYLFRLPDVPYALCVLVAQLLSLLGDMMLLGQSQRAFLGGLGSFLLAHVAYARAFLELGHDAQTMHTALAALAPASLGVLAYLLPHLPARMRLPVGAYLAAVTGTAALALAAWPGLSEPRKTLVPAGALLFYLSDFFVARERFVTPGFLNQALGLPLYYAAQLLLVHSTLYVE